MSAFGGKADLPSAPILWAHGSPLAAQNRTEDGLLPLSKCRTKAQCRFGLRSGSFSCHWYKTLVSSHPVGSEILSSSLLLRAVVGVSLRARHLRTKPRACAVSGGLPAITVAREAFSPIILILSAPTSISEITEWR